MKANLSLHKWFISCLTTSVALSGCSFFGGSTTPSPIYTAVEIYLSRGSLVGTEFEHYKLTKGVLFYECGKQNRKGFEPTEQEILSIPPSAVGPLVSSLKNLDNERAESAGEWERPGTSLSLTDPGQIKITVTSKEKESRIETSLDSIALPKGRKEQALKAVVRRLRSFTKKSPCGNRDFYGFGNL